MNIRTVTLPTRRADITCTHSLPVRLPLGPSLTTGTGRVAEMVDHHIFKGRPTSSSQHRQKARAATGELESPRVDAV